MNSKLVLAVVVILLLLYVLFKALTTSYATLGGMQASKNETTLTSDTLPKSFKANSAISVWFFIKEWKTKIDNTAANIVRFTGPSGAPMYVSIKMEPTTNTVTVTTKQASGGGQDSTCSISDFPIQKWVNLIVSYNGSVKDIYVDGKLVKSCVVAGGTQINTTNVKQIILGEKDIDYGFITNVKLKSTPIAPQEAWDIYSQGYGGSPWSDILNKYKVKLSFLVDNQEQATVST